jgi:hypothetical protein
LILTQITKEKYGRLDLNINVAGIGHAARTWNFKQNMLEEHNKLVDKCLKKDRQKY